MRVYDKEFKEEAIKLSNEIGPKGDAKQLGIPETTIYTWRSQTKQHGLIAFAGSGNKRIDPNAAEIKKMEKKIKDWKGLYGFEPVLLETFVDSGRFNGTCYQAANWIWVGQTQGCGKMGKNRRQRGFRVKDVYLYPLTPDFRQILTERKV